MQTCSGHYIRSRGELKTDGFHIERQQILILLLSFYFPTGASEDRGHQSPNPKIKQFEAVKIAITVCKNNLKLQVFYKTWLGMFEQFGTEYFNTFQSYFVTRIHSLLPRAK